MAVQIQARRGTASEWTTENPTLAAGEPGLETDTGKFKWGNGTDAWDDLDYAAGDSATPQLDTTSLTDDTASTTGVWEQWGTEEIAVPNPGRSVKIWVIATGNIDYQASSGTIDVGWMRVQISTDGGGTWVDQQEIFARIEVSGSGDPMPFAAQGFVAATPTGEIQARVQLQQGGGSAGDMKFNRGDLTLLVL